MLFMTVLVTNMGLPVSAARLKHSLQILLSFRAEAKVPERTEARN